MKPASLHNKRERVRVIFQVKVDPADAPLQHLSWTAAILVAPGRERSISCGYRPVVAQNVSAFLSREREDAEREAAECGLPVQAVLGWMAVVSRGSPHGL